MTLLGFVDSTFPNNSFAYDISDSRQVVGRSTSNRDSVLHAFYWDANVGMVSLGTLGGSGSEAHGINERDDVVGWSRTADGATHATLWELRVARSPRL